MQSLWRCQLAFFAILWLAQAYPTGAPTTCGCPDCVPPHSAGEKAGFDATITRSPDDDGEWIAGRTYTFTVTGSFAGAFFSATDGDLADDSGVNFRAYGGSCPSDITAITHKHDSTKTNPTFTWTAPTTGSGSMTLNFLILPAKLGQYQKTTFGPLVEGFVNCSEADTATCDAFNRGDCGETTDNTCGDCDTGYFGPEDENTACTECNEACAECEDATTTCAVCASGYGKQGGSCVEVATCDALPQACDSIGRQDCLTVTDTCGPCLAKYFNPTTQNTDSNDACIACDVACATCTNASTTCTTCATGYTRNSTGSCQEVPTLRPFGKDANRLASDNSCEVGECLAEVLWEFEGDVVWFKLSTTKYWVGVGFAKQRQMLGDFYIGLTDGTDRVINAYGSKPNPPTRDAVPTLDNVVAISENGRFEVVFSRPREPTNGDRDASLDEDSELYVLLAWGSGSGDSFSIHDGRVITEDAILVGQSVGSLTSSTPTLARDKTIAHGILMLLAWVGLSPLGTYIARYYKLAGPVWFQLHRGAQVVAVLLALVGWVIILTDNDVGKQGTHHRMGMATIALAFVQVLLGAFRNQISGFDKEAASDPDDHGPRRWLFNYLHWIVGRTLLVFAPATVYYGLDVLGAEDAPKSVLLATCGVLVGFFVVSEVIKCRGDPSKKPMTVLVVAFALFAVAGAVAMAVLVADTPKVV
eukprot:m.126804 g.126804  ORF g.126804 m.126804 type:complete len:700 (-) comp15782_c0_seq3:33-2132(-)